MKKPQYETLLNNLNKKLQTQKTTRKILQKQIQQLEELKQSYEDRFKYYEPIKLSRIGKKTQESPTKTENSFSFSPSKYQKMVEDVRDQIEELKKRIKVKEKRQHLSEDAIINNLWNKIQEEQREIEEQYEGEKILKIKNSTIHFLHQKIEELRIKIFKNKKNKEIQHKQQLNRNRDIVREGYTEKMKKIISLHK